MREYSVDDVMFKFLPFTETMVARKLYVETHREEVWWEDKMIF